jgi:hypothetical protein
MPDFNDTNDFFDDDNKGQEYSLESILAEYKGSAFIKGESKTAKHELEKQAEKIIAEALGNTPPQDASSDNPLNDLSDLPDDTKTYTPRSGDLIKNRSVPEPGAKKKKRGLETGMREVEQRLARVSKIEEQQNKMFSDRELSDDEQEFFGVGKYAVPEVTEMVGDEVEKTISDEQRRRERRKKRRAERRNAQRRRRSRSDSPDNELRPSDALRIYGSRTAGLSIRLFPMLILCLIMAAITFSRAYGILMPEFIRRSDKNFELFLFFALIAAAVLCFDILSLGLSNLFTGRFSQETLVSLSVILSTADAAVMAFGGDHSFGAPFCAISAFSLFGALWGTYKGRKAFYFTFKTASNVKVPTIVSPEWEKVNEGSVMTKYVGSIRGFVNKSTEADLAERVYTRLAPILIAISIIVSALIAVLSKKPKLFLHCLSMFLAVSASFRMVHIFNAPFYRAAKALYAHGAALAGWRGACDMDKAVGIVYKDNDIFPDSEISISGVKILQPSSAARVVCYTGSLIIAAGIGTSRLFAQLMREYNSPNPYRVDEFSCYESGGVGAYIEGHHVIVGSSAFMNLMGIRLPPNLDYKSTVFSAIDDELAGIFVISYSPSNSVKHALQDMHSAKITPIYAIRDFNITPSLIKNRFKINVSEGEFSSYTSRFELSSKSEDYSEIPSAILSREGVNHYTESVYRGKSLVKQTKISLAITLFETLAGLLLLILLASSGSFVAASAANTLTYMIIWAIISELISYF